ncbi:MAG TPA: OmpH family outer membrane protein [Vicinamibacteria bacterium]|jgi:outer membrane protein|nr:OmpH family outer membrane protein [Vicinamibacteria bacterium]
MKKTFLVALGLCASAAVALAQTPAPAQGTTPAARGPIGSPKIAVIDMQQISAESVLGKSYASKIEGLENEIKSEGTKKQGELQKMDAAIKALQDELDKQGSVLSPEAADKKRQDIVKRQRDRQAFLEDGQADLQRMKERAEAQAQAMNAEFQQKLKPAIDAVAKEKGIDILLTSQVALLMNQAYDISKDIIAKADEAAKTAAAAAPAAPAAKPAGPVPAAPKPAPSPKG